MMLLLLLLLQTAGTAAVTVSAEMMSSSRDHRSCRHHFRQLPPLSDSCWLGKVDNPAMRTV
jgi:hypothetical protein